MNRKGEKMFKKCVCLLILSTFLFQIPAYSQVNVEQIKSLAPELMKQLGKEGNTGAATQPNTEQAAPQQKTVEEEQVSQIENLMMGTEPGDIPLQQFGYSVFQGAPSTFAAPANLIVGPDYVMGPGDSFSVTLWGISEGSFLASVNKEGNITLPKAGVVSVAGVR